MYLGRYRAGSLIPVPLGHNGPKCAPPNGGTFNDPDAVLQAVVYKSDGSVVAGAYLSPKPQSDTTPNVTAGPYWSPLFTALLTAPTGDAGIYLVHVGYVTAGVASAEAHHFELLAGLVTTAGPVRHLFNQRSADGTLLYRQTSGGYGLEAGPC